MAPTALLAQKTETTPFGRDVCEAGYPLRGPEMVAAIAPEGSYVARGSVSHVNRLKNYLQRGLQNQMNGGGISFVYRIQDAAIDIEKKG